MSAKKPLPWEVARDETLILWRNIRRMIDTPNEIELLTEVNAICALCEAAGQREPYDLTRCERCLAFVQFGGCRQVNLEMSQRIVDKNWDELRRLVDDFIGHLEGLEIPPRDSAPS